MNDTWFPKDYEIEKSVLGTFIAQQDILDECIDMTFPDLFYSDHHKAILEAIKDIYSKNSRVDLVSVSHRLREINRLDFIGGPIYLTQLTDFSYSNNTQYHIRLLQQLWIKREQIILGQRTINEAHDAGIDVFESIEIIESKLNEINTAIIGKELQADIKTDVEAAFERNTNPMQVERGIKTGSASLNNILGGWKKKKLYILAARPSVGKTTRAIQFAKYAALVEKESVAFFSVEMTTGEIIDQMLLNDSEIDSKTIRDQNWMIDEKERYAAAKERIKYSKLHIYDMPVLRPSLVRATGRKLKREKGLGMIVIDYIQLMKSNEKQSNREREIGSIATELKIISKELDVPIIALSQLSRESEKRPNKRPMLSDLRESGQIEQDADVVMTMYCPSTYGPDTEYAHMNEEMYSQAMELSVLKHRGGKAGIIIREQFLKSKSLFQ